MTRSLAVLVLLVGVAVGADPKRPDVKEYPDGKWEKDGVTAEVAAVEFSKDVIGVRLRVTNGTKGEIGRKDAYLDEVFTKTGKPDVNGPLVTVRLIDGLGDSWPAVARSLAIPGFDEVRPVKGGESGILTVVFPRPPASGRYFLSMPAVATGLPDTVKMSFPANKLTPEDSKPEK